jgi:hypothetical protein
MPQRQKQSRPRSRSDSASPMSVSADSGVNGHGRRDNHLATAQSR